MSTVTQSILLVMLSSRFNLKSLPLKHTPQPLASW